MVRGQKGKILTPGEGPTGCASDPHSTPTVRVDGGRYEQSLDAEGWSWNHLYFLVGTSDLRHFIL